MADLCARKGFRGSPWLDVEGSLQLLNSDHVRVRDKALLGGVLAGGVWSGFLLSKVKGRFCGGTDSDGHLLWKCTFFHFLLRFVNTLSFMISWRWISRLGLGVCFGMVGCFFSLWGVNGASPWAAGAADSASYLVESALGGYSSGSPRKGASNLLECALGPYSSGLLTEWQLPVVFDAEFAAGRVAAGPDVWTDGSLVQDKVSGASSSGSGFAICRDGHLCDRRWGHLDDEAGGERDIGSCCGYCSVLGPLQTVQRADFWEVVILALQAADGIHLGVGNLNVTLVACKIAVLILVLLSL